MSNEGVIAMLETISLEEAQASLPVLIERLQPDTKIVITRNQQPVAALHAHSGALPQPRFEIGRAHV